MEYMQFMRERITELRLAKGIRSERELSRRLGKNEQYIQHITSGRQNMGWDAFFELCRYFDITPQEFFDPDLHHPDRIREGHGKAAGGGYPPAHGYREKAVPGAGTPRMRRKRPDGMLGCSACREARNGSGSGERSGGAAAYSRLRPGFQGAACGRPLPRVCSTRGASHSGRPLARAGGEAPCSACPGPRAGSI